MKKTALVLLNEDSRELLLFVKTGKSNEDTFPYMRFEKQDTATAVYYAIKKASSLRYDYGYDRVKIEINGLASSEMSCVVSTKLVIS